MAEFTEKSLVQNIASDSELENAIATSQKNPIVIFFWANWHEPSCPGGQMDVLFSSLAKKFKAVKFFHIEAELFASATEKFTVTVVPTFVFFSGGNVVTRIEGVHPDQLASLVKDMSIRFQSSIECSTSMKPSSTNSLDSRLNKLVNSAPVMLFMKGSPESPRCGFSRKIVEILQNNQIPFASFDILTDNDVREGLKKLFDWPTYPQLYVNGNLVGGLDIIVEMMQSGDLKNQLLPNHDQEQIINSSAPLPLETRLKALIEQAPVMIFIKGTPTSPKCGFSNTLIEILNSENIQFSSFDILADEEVRQGLKSFSDWPTYPQVYVKGSLIGGLDIVKEMLSSGSLREQFGI